MASGTLRELYHAELEDLYDAEQQIVQALPTLASRATSPDLKDAFARHLERSRIHIERLDLLFDKFGLRKTGYKSTAIEALIRDGERRMTGMTASDVADAALIAAAQHVEHYEIAGYGCARTYARQLGDDDAADLLQQTLDEEGATDKRLTDIADEINRAAAEPETEATRPAARLRYVDVNDMDGERYEYRDYKIRDAAGEGIGSVDGFLVDASGRPYYVVVDSGGLFVGRRYIVPIGKATLDRSGRAFSIGLDKDTLKRYPEFHRDAFIAMSDDEARRYEWRVLEAIDPAAARKTPRTWDYDQFDYYRRPDWADEAWRGDIGAAQRTRDRQDVSTPSASKRRDRDASVTVPDRDEERVLAREEQIVTPDEDLDREPPRERITGTERDQPKRRGE